MGTLRDLELVAKKELINEDAELGKEIIKERLKEIRDAKKTLAKMEKQYQELLDKKLEDIEDECC